MKRLIEGFLALSGAVALLLTSGATLPAATIVDRPGTVLATDGDPLSTFEWTQTDTYMNVAITVGLYNYASGFRLGEIYLTDKIGVGTTQAANQIAYATVFETTRGGSYWNALSGLTLGAGTYYLSYRPTDGGLFDNLLWGLNTTTATTAPGVTTAYDFAGSPLAAYAPATPSNHNGALDLNPIVTITGDLVASQAPEPSTVAFAGAALLALGATRRRRA